MVLLGKLKALTAIRAEGHRWDSTVNFELTGRGTGLLPRREQERACGVRAPGPACAPAWPGGSRLVVTVRPRPPRVSGGVEREAGPPRSRGAPRAGELLQHPPASRPPSRPRQGLWRQDGWKEQKGQRRKGRQEPQQQGPAGLPICISSDEPVEPERQLASGVPACPNEPPDHRRSRGDRRGASGQPGRRPACVVHRRRPAEGRSGASPPLSDSGRHHRT